MAAKEMQLNLRLAPVVNRWLERVAGGKARRAEYVRVLIEDAMRRQAEEDALTMFNRAAADVDAEERSDREASLGVFANRAE